LIIYYSNIFDAIKSNSYKLVFIDPRIENYEEICKLAVQQKYKKSYNMLKT
jgi:hypothetical protein